MIISGFFAGLPIFGKILIVLILSGFMPLTAITFFKYMLPKKERDYKKAMDDMGINSSRQVSDSYAPRRYFLPVFFVTLLCLLASIYFTFADTFIESINDSLLLTGSWFGEGNVALVRQSLAILTFAFLGGFIWSAQNIIRRLIAIDLAPSVYYSAGVRIIMASAVALVLSFIIGEESSTNLVNFKSSLSAVAFLTGMFPERILQYLIKLFKRYINPDPLNTELLSLYQIEGISMQHKERLEEIGIDNAQNLATASLTQLCIDTPYEARTLLDWIGQAKLLCYAKEHIAAMRSTGIRTVFDFYKGDKSTARLQRIAILSSVDPLLIENISEQVRADTGIQALFRFQGGVNTPNEAISPGSGEPVIPILKEKEPNTN